MSSTKQDAVQGDKLKLFQALVETNPNVELKKAKELAPYFELSFQYVQTPKRSLQRKRKAREAWRVVRCLACEAVLSKGTRSHTPYFRQRSMSQPESLVTHTRAQTDDVRAKQSALLTTASQARQRSSICYSRSALTPAAL